MLRLTLGLLGREAAAAERTLMKFCLWERERISSRWLWSEKFDGIRAHSATGSAVLITRRGGTLAAPEEFIQCMQDFNKSLVKALLEHYRSASTEALCEGVTDVVIVLDGELWGGRDRFQDLVSAVKTTRVTNPPQERWKFQSGLGHAHAEELLEQSEIVRAQKEGTNAAE
eukprot:Hpha_TRINITY_DN9110_c1_g1::TRINITY_DN9110_c1_g1_i1::g.94401::m.94401